MRKLLLLVLCTLSINASTYSPMEFYNLENNVKTEEDMSKMDTILGEFRQDHYVTNIKQDYEKVFNPCFYGYCKEEELKQYYSKKDIKKITFNNEEFDLFVKIEDNRIKNLHLIREIKRETYQTQTNQQKINLGFFQRNSSLLRNNLGARYVVESCQINSKGISAYKFNDINTFRQNCAKMYISEIKQIYYVIKENYKSLNSPITLDYDIKTLSKRIQNREIKFPFKREINYEIDCAKDIKCYEKLTISNENAKAFYEEYEFVNSYIFPKSFNIKSKYKEEVSKIICNDNIEEKLNQKEYENRLLCKDKKEITEKYYFQKLLLDKYNEKREKPINVDSFYNILQDLYNKLAQFKENEKESFVYRQLLQKYTILKGYYDQIVVLKPLFKRDYFKVKIEDIYTDNKYSKDFLYKILRLATEDYEEIKKTKIQKDVDVAFSKKERIKEIISLKGYDR